MKSSRRGGVDLLGWSAGAVAIAVTVFAFVYLVALRPFYAGESAGDFPARFGGWEREEKTETVEGTVSTLVLKNVSGPVEIEAGERDSIQVRYVKEARGRQALADFPVEIARSGDTLTVRPIYLRGGGIRFGPVSFELAIPRTVRRIEVSNISGRIETRGIPAETEQNLTTVSGRIEVAEGGPLQARSTSGSVQFVSRGPRIAVQTVSGSIEGRIPALDAQGSVEVGSVSGAVRLEAFDALSAQVLLASTSGSVSCAFPLTASEMRRSRVEGRIGGGTVPLRVRTVSGGIRLDRLEPGS